MTVDRSPKSQFQTRFSNSSREKTVSVWVRKNSSRSNSRLVSPTDSPAMLTDRAAVDTLSSPTLISSGTVDGVDGARRSTERTRRANSRGLNGFVT